MLQDNETPLKEIDNITSPNQQRTLSALIFSGSTQKSHRNRHAEKRYSKENQVFDKIEIIEVNEDIKLGKLLTYNEPSHLRTKSKHRRKSSIDENFQLYEKTNKFYVKHSRNISDTDSVIYKQTEEDLKKHSNYLPVRGSLPILESTPCTVYCKFCEKQVHSVIDFYNSRIPQKVLNLFSSIVTCCQGSVWLNDMKVHRCPFCKLVLGKVGSPRIL